MCHSDFDCQNTLACSNGQCTPYGSIDTFESSTNPLACKSGFVSEILDEDSLETLQLCLPTPEIISHEGPEYLCASPSDSCTYLSHLEDGHPLEFTHPCQCGLTPDALAFCPVVYDSYYTQLVAQVTVQSSQKFHECHTLDRLNIYECLILNIGSIDELRTLDNYI